MSTLNGRIEYCSIRNRNVERKKKCNGVSEGGGGRIPHALKRWMDEEHEEVAVLEFHVLTTFKNGKANLELWLTDLASEEAEWSAYLYFDKAI